MTYRLTLTCQSFGTISFLLVSACMLISPATAREVEVAGRKDAADVIAYVDGRCAPEHLAFKAKGLAENDIIELSNFFLVQDSNLENASKRLMGMPLAVWQSSYYAVSSNTDAATEVDNSSVEMRKQIVGSIEVSVALMRCLSPSEGNWKAYMELQNIGEDQIKDFRNLTCVLPWAEKVNDLLRGDLENDALGVALEGAKIEFFYKCREEG